MPATADQLKVARSWIGTTEEDATFNERFDRLEGDIDAAILESLRAQYSVLVLDQPGQVSTPDGMSANFQENIRSLRTAIEDFVNSGGTDPETIEAGGPSITRIHRADRR
jgi:hypothetical protein